MTHSATVQEILLREWHAEPGATSDELAGLQNELPFRLPDAYRALLLASNGGEGPLDISPLNLCLYDVAFARETWRDPFYREQYPNYFFFGSSGGGDSIAMDISSGHAGNIVAIDCIAGEDSKKVIAPNFEQFLLSVGRNAEQ